MSEVPAFVKHLRHNTIQRRRLLGERFGVITTLGRGSFGDVVLVEDRQAKGALAVVKRSRTSGDDAVKKTAAAAAAGVAAEQIRAAIAEATIMTKFNDDCIVRLMDFWYEECEGGVCFLMEYCNGGDLENYLQRHYPLSEELLLLLFLQCLIAVAHMHTKEVVHRDLKLSNILVCGNNVCTIGRKGSRKVPKLKVADFGLSAMSTENNAMDGLTCVGTPLFMSPETVAEGLCGYGSDVWSLGVVFYRMMTNRQPFTGDDFSALRLAITSTEPPHPSVSLRGRYSQEVGDLIMGMLTKNPLTRPCARQLIASPLFTQFLLQCPWRSKQLRGALSLFACRTDHVVYLFAEPRTDSKIVATLHFADHVFVDNEVHIRERQGRRSVSRSVPSTASPETCATVTTNTTAEPIQDVVVVWCHVVGPHIGYCIKYEHGRGVLRHVGDPTPCGPLPPPPPPLTKPATTIKGATITAGLCESPERGSSPEPMHPTVLHTTRTFHSPRREKTRSSSAGNLFSLLFRQCG
ncbi:Protein kinase domain [Trypanosoma melophagium]|uniref:Protein kinase domain n=1 Tax=Trypanosoma melophagium TaxID=715481 RepID=UPI00351A590B|nr:Protein kinase domain [Trypanosoma melophagium]